MKEAQPGTSTIVGKQRLLKKSSIEAKKNHFSSTSMAALVEFFQQSLFADNSESAGLRFLHEVDT